jgi:hypothetical protein
VVIRRGKDRPQEFSDTHQPQGVPQPPPPRLRKLPRRLLHQSKQRQTARQRKPTSVRSHRQSPAMNATTASFLGLRWRQRGQDLFREAPRKAPWKALRRAPASQCARASQSAIRIATISFVHVNCTAQSRVTLIHCIAHQLLVNLVAEAVLAMFAPPAQGGVGAPQMQRSTQAHISKSQTHHPFYIVAAAAIDFALNSCAS